MREVKRGREEKGTEKTHKFLLEKQKPFIQK